ncbi:MAG: OmpA family protein [Pseudomonadota bacterium]
MSKSSTVCGVLSIGLLMAGPVQTQELTLDSFGLDDEPSAKSSAPIQDSSSEIETCLLDPAACSNAELRSGSSLSIEDVVNLGIVDRGEIPATQTGASGQIERVNTSQTLPSIDMEILFDYNSANIRADQAVRLAELSVVLRDPKFDNFTLAFIGHTDAVGSDAYNRRLSQRRAEEVALFISRAANFGLDRTTATGLGFSRLKTPSDPAGPQNRRVQLVLIPR